MATIQKYKTLSGETKYRVRYWHAGKQKSKSFPKLSMAKEYKANVEQNKYTGTYISRNTITVGELLAKWTEFKKGTVRASTLEGYKNDVSNIKKYIGSIAIQELTAIDIETMYNAHGKILSQRSVSGMHKVLSMAMKYARKGRLLQANPMDTVDGVSQGSAHVKVMEYTDIPLYLECVKGSWIYPAVVLALFLGMRRGEIAALKWSEVNFEQGYIFVKASENIVDKKLVRTKPKNHEMRYIPLPISVASVLIAHKNKCANFNSDYVILTYEGNKPRPDSISQLFERRQKKAELKKVSFHSLKHTASTLMEYFNVNPKVASTILAHKKVEFTNKVYKYVFDEQMEEARDTIEMQISERFSL